MDNHPIPQDVTGFQFRLIGDMTIKQFAYLAAGVGFAWILFIMPVFVLVKFPLALLSAGIGVLLAFVPIEGRPADTMFVFFLKALFSPSQYLYQQGGGSSTPVQQQKAFVKQDDKKGEKEEEKKDKKIHFEGMTRTLASDVINPQEKKTEEVVAPATTSEKDTTLSAESLPPTPVIQEQQLSQEAKNVVEALQEAKQEEQQKKGTQEATIAHEKVTQLEDELQTIMAQKEALEKQLLELQQQLQQKKQQVFTPTTAQEPKETAHVRKVPTSMGTVVGAPLMSDVPNLISGVVKDSRGNVLPNMLIEVKDKDGNPVRAFKTNALGQFASATPILNGVYTITFEDPGNKHKFDTIEVPANGEIMMPLEVISVDQREELRRELFGG